jgi:glutamine amidotransferase
VNGIKRAVTKLNNKNVSYSSLNFVASDGRKLYALRYAKIGLGYYTLYYLRRPREGLRLESFSKRTAQLIRMKLASGEKTIIISSEKLTEEPWDIIPNRHMLIVDGNLSTELMEIS